MEKSIFVDKVTDRLTHQELADLHATCAKCLAYNLVHSATFKGLDDGVFVSTGDVPGEWIRDGSVQLGIYLSRSSISPEILSSHSLGTANVSESKHTLLSPNDSTSSSSYLVSKPSLYKSSIWRRLVQGGILAQAKFITLDPWANSFSSDWIPFDKLSTEDRVMGKGGLVNSRNFEADSGAYFLNLLHNFLVSSPAVASSDGGERPMGASASVGRGRGRRGRREDEGRDGEGRGGEGRERVGIRRWGKEEVRSKDETTTSAAAAGFGENAENLITVKDDAIVNAVNAVNTINGFDDSDWDYNYRKHNGDNDSDLDDESWLRKRSNETIHLLDLAITATPYDFLNSISIRTAVRTVIRTWQIEQHHEALSPYRYIELPRNGIGSKVSYTGMVWTGFRPSDDPALYGYNVPVNMMIAGSLRRALDLNRRIWRDKELRRAARKLMVEIERGIEMFGVVEASITESSFQVNMDPKTPVEIAHHSIHEKWIQSSRSSRGSWGSGSEGMAEDGERMKSNGLQSMKHLRGMESRQRFFGHQMNQSHNVSLSAEPPPPSLVHSHEVVGNVAGSSTSSLSSSRRRRRHRRPAASGKTWIYAYEVDGLGHVLSDFDDPNLPSLLTVPLLSYDAYDKEIYRTTRRRLLDDRFNPVFNRFATATSIEGFSSTHTPYGNIWPLAIISRALTAGLAAGVQGVPSDVRYDDHAFLKPKYLMSPTSFLSFSSTFSTSSSISSSSSSSSSTTIISSPKHEEGKAGIKASSPLDIAADEIALALRHLLFLRSKEGLMHESCRIHLGESDPIGSRLNTLRMTNHRRNNGRVRAKEGRGRKLMLEMDLNNGNRTSISNNNPSPLTPRNAGECTRKYFQWANAMYVALYEHVFGKSCEDSPVVRRAEETIMTRAMAHLSSSAQNSVPLSAVSASRFNARQLV
eukprot:CAMPEP_0175042304 /NCGR_PEP_ID=MMETSP0052_2-20121109/2478_1 /TAXON_ID=51329 ORGANISM="Polytomella parva, Strain SAG 63-3" /NCGR_SAMPLE_ID=MMETSP0052_2 /ASSEMBLY_ACC=CAM_ASM_000194 /LENGTH=920 /DNA_ID=CAMNT_0016305079 /DNA_START=119 /DNA_END=2881 /DNA_ORIENTATION=+